MPELPEVEITRRGIAPYVEGNPVARVDIHTRNLRWPVPDEIRDILPGRLITEVERRGKYLLLHTHEGCALVHLGMTGYLHILQEYIQPDKHDHVDIIFESGVILRLNDVRRFGCLLWIGELPYQHQLLHGIGPEPLKSDFDAEYLFLKSRNKKVPVKQFLMDQKVVAGVGNIYANEALFHARIRPDIKSGDLSLDCCSRIVDAIKAVIVASIDAGGTMIDYRSGSGLEGHFPRQYAVYRRGGEPCRVCNTLIEQRRIGRRSIYFCGMCQS